MAAPASAGAHSRGQGRVRLPLSQQVTRIAASGLQQRLTWLSWPCPNRVSPAAASTTGTPSLVTCLTWQIDRHKDGNWQQLPFHRHCLCFRGSH